MEISFHNEIKPMFPFTISMMFESNNLPRILQKNNIELGTTHDGFEKTIGQKISLTNHLFKNLTTTEI